MPAYTQQIANGTIFKIAIAVILIVAAGIYFNALGNQFIYDDNEILNNNWIKDIRFIPEIFTSNLWGFKSETATSNYYRPMVHMIFMVNYHLFGPAPWGFHLTNILFHAAISVMVFVITRRLLEKFRPFEAPSLWPAFGASLLFATHPIHTEAVAWISGLVDLSYTFFLLLSFYLYIRAEEGMRGGYTASVISFGLAALCKEPALVFPFILSAYVYISRREKDTSFNYLRRCIPYFAAAVLYLVLRLNALGGFSPAAPYLQLSTYEYVINVFPLFMQYLQKLLLPINLNAFHVFHPVSSVFSAKTILSLTVAAAFALVSFISLWRKRFISLGLLFIALPLLPALYIRAINHEIVFAERYLYLPSFGFVILIASALSWTAEVKPKLAAALSLCVLALTVCYSIATMNRNRIWKDELTFYTDALKKSPDSLTVHYNLGLLYANQGMIQEAIHELQTTLAIKPDYGNAHYDLGVIYAGQGMIQEAMLEFQAELRLNPQQGWAQKMSEDMAAKIKLKELPDNFAAHNNLGIAYANQGRLQEAINEFIIALEINPDNYNVYYNLGNVYLMQGQIQEAINQYVIFLKARPDFGDAHSKLGIAYAKQGQIQEAINEFKEALRLNPEDIDTRENLELLNQQMKK